MDFEQYALATFVLIGLVNGVQLAFDRNWRAFVLWMIAVVSGTAFGFFGWFGLSSMEIGLAIGINSSGVYKVGQVLGNKVK